ncbi:DUF5911 domain-containing protein [bacterium]|nr:DUF5911 domain-containing protein [bacterium]
MAYRPIKDYRLIGDLHSAALVSSEASIDWLCWPAFDSPSMFAAILDDERGGRFSVLPDGRSAKSTYRPETAIVETVFVGDDFEFSVRDMMEPQPADACPLHVIVRSFRGLRGSGTVRLHFDPRPGFGSGAPRLDDRPGPGLRFRDGEHEVRLFLPRRARIDGATAGCVIAFELAEGERTRVVLDHGDEKGTPFAGLDHPYEAHTEEFWREWVAGGKFPEFRRERLIRSAITLKLMQYYPTGAIVAAPTTSLPEAIGGVRNWDYRYVWLRDATFTLYALSVLGMHAEATRFFHYLEDVLTRHGAMRVRHMYTIRGEIIPDEKRLEHLAGYRNSVPVRKGNLASDQFQLDVYGIIIDSIYFSARHGVAITEGMKNIAIWLGEQIEKRWRTPDAGIWEVRREPVEFTYSKVMCWVGIDRLIRMRELLGLPDDRVAKLEAFRGEIRAFIEGHCYDAKRGVLRQSPGAPSQDATNFLFVLLHYLDKHDPRTRTIIENTRRELGHGDAFIYRYRTPDGVPGDEEAFILCTYWLISALAIIEDVDAAERLLDEFEKLFGESGLMSEEIEPASGAYTGNFPQAFSHLGYIMAANYVNRYREKRGNRK